MKDDHPISEKRRGLLGKGNEWKRLSGDQGLNLNRGEVRAYEPILGGGKCKPLRRPAKRSNSIKEPAVSQRKGEETACALQGAERVGGKKRVP